MGAGRVWWDRVVVGIGLGLLLHLMQIPFTVACVVFGVWWVRDSPPTPYRLLAVAALGAASLLYVGFTQLLYMAPALVVSARAGRMRLARGVLGVAATT